MRNSMLGRCVALRVIGLRPTATRTDGWIVAPHADGDAARLAARACTLRTGMLNWHMICESHVRIRSEPMGTCVVTLTAA